MSKEEERKGDHQGRNKELAERLSALEELAEKGEDVQSDKEELAAEVLTANSGWIASRIKPFSRYNVTIVEDLWAVASAEAWRTFCQWDPERGTLSGYGTPWIDGAIKREVAKQVAPHMSYDDFTARGKIHKEIKGEDETIDVEEIAKRTGLGVALVRRALTQGAVSLETPVGDDRILYDVLVGQADTFGEEAYSEALELHPEDVVGVPLDELTAYLLSTGGGLVPGVTKKRVAEILEVPDREASRLVGLGSLAVTDNRLLRIGGRRGSVEELKDLTKAPKGALEEYMRRRDEG